MTKKLVATGTMLAMPLAGPAFAQHSSPNVRSIQQALDESASEAAQQQTLRVAALPARGAAPRQASGDVEAGGARPHTRPLPGRT